MKDLQKLEKVERDGIEFYKHPVSFESKPVGFAPIPVCASSEEVKNFIGEKNAFEASYRQLFADGGNKVRDKFRKDALSASDVVALYASGQMTSEKTDEANAYVKAHNVNFNVAVAAVLGLDNEQPDSKQIHWDILPRLGIKI